jgi:hypothetical protein
MAGDIKRLVMILGRGKKVEESSARVLTISGAGLLPPTGNCLTVPAQ